MRRHPQRHWDTPVSKFKWKGEPGSHWLASVRRDDSLKFKRKKNFTLGGSTCPGIVTQQGQRDRALVYGKNNFKVSEDKLT